MAIIPLRAYNHEIEGLIDNKQLDEAVAHCRHILSTFPKYIATYRLLGKAHLEQQRISDATDIFQRVLSAIPDDFTANVGMSIIREDENNLDASIWHMELAYEAQPSNVAIQDELRRLFGRRDGTQPPKVRLTRGALARMYAKGGLFDQAIAELRAAINEDPNRPDLQLLLAQMLYQISQRVDAVETCVNILKKLPLCLSANQILAVCLPEVEGSNTRKNYRQTAIAMDPDFAFADLESINSDQVPDNAVNIEKFEWKPGIQMSDSTEQPTWATSLGVSLDKPAEEHVPDWLQDTDAPTTAEPNEQAQNPVSPFLWDTQEVKNIITDDRKTEEEIPEWMKDAGWKSSTGETEAGQNESILEDLSPENAESDLAKADIPDWLRGIAPEGILEDKSTTSQPEEKDESLPWLEKKQPGPTDSIIQWLEEKKPETPVSKTESIEPSGEGQEEIPEWLKDLDVPVGTPEPQQTEDHTDTSPTEMPALIEEPPGEETTLPEVAEVPVLEEKQESVPQVEQVVEPVEGSFEVEETRVEELSLSAGDDLPDWIKELAGILPASPPQAAVKESEPQPTIVEEEPVVKSSAFLEEITSLESTPEEPLQVGQPVEPSLSSSDTEILSWMEEPPAEASSQDVEQTTPIVEQPASSLDWLNLEATNETSPSQIEPETGQSSALPVEEVPDWIKGLGEPLPEETSPEPVSETPTEEIPPELVSETPTEEIPPEPVSETPIEEIPPEPVSETPTEEIPPEPVSEAPVEEVPQQVEELPSWLLEFEQPAQEAETTQPVPEALEWKEESLPDWIREITEVPPAEEGVKVSENDEILSTPVETESEWTPEVADLPMPDAAVPLEAPPEEQVLLSEADRTEQPVTSPTLDTEPVAEIVSEEITSQEAEVPSSVLPEAPPAVSPPAQQADLPTLESARNAINQGLPSEAAGLYASLVHRALHLDDVLKDLQDAVYRFPVDVNLWVTLGDTYFQKNELQEALNTYSKAEELVR